MSRFGGTSMYVWCVCVCAHVHCMCAKTWKEAKGKKMENSVENSCGKYHSYGLWRHKLLLKSIKANLTVLMRLFYFAASERSELSVSFALVFRAIETCMLLCWRLLFVTNADGALIANWYCYDIEYRSCFIRSYKSSLRFSFRAIALFVCLFVFFLLLMMPCVCWFFVPKLSNYIPVFGVNMMIRAFYR